MTFLAKCLAIFVFMILPIGLFLVFGYFILRRVFKKDAYKSPFRKVGKRVHSYDHDDDSWHDSNGSSTGHHFSSGGSFSGAGASGDFDDSAGGDAGGDD